MGTELLAAATKPASSSSTTTLLIIVVVFVLLMFFMFRSQRRRQQNAQNVQRQVQNGSRVRTVHGIFGTVVDGDDRNVMVEIAPGVKVKMMRQAIGQVLPDDEPDGVLHTDTDQSSGWSADEDHGSEDQSSEEPSDLSR
jgi:preprotein translocase subunit YajC